MSVSSTSPIPPNNKSLKKTYGKSNYKQRSTFLESNFDSLMSKYNSSQNINLDNIKSTTTNPSNNFHNINSGTFECTPKDSIQTPTKTSNKASTHQIIKNKSVSLPAMKSNNPFDTKAKNTPTKFINYLPKRTSPVLLIPQTQSADLFGFPESGSDTEAGPISQQIVDFRRKRNRIDRHALAPPVGLEEPSADNPPRLKSPKQDKNKQTKQKPRLKQQDSKSPKRPKEHGPVPFLPVELFDVKQPHQCRELGQQQMFRDEVQYLLDGIKPARSLSTRCLALCSLASECLSPLFRRQLSFHQLMSQLTQSLSDTPASPPPLRLAAAALLYALSRDRSSTELDSGTILVILRLTAEYGQTGSLAAEPLSQTHSVTEKGVQEFELSQATKNTTTRVSDFLGSLEPTESHPLPPKGPLTHQLLALMALQSLISLQKEDFSRSLSEMGALESATTLIAASLNAVTRINQAKTDGQDTENKSRSIKYSKYKKSGNNIAEFSLDSQCTVHIFVLSLSLLILNGITKKHAPSLQPLAGADTKCAQLPHLLFRCIQINREFLQRDPTCIVAYECLKQVMMSVTELCNEVEQFSREIYESAEFLTSLVECVLTIAPTFIKEYQFDVQIIGLMALVNHLAKSNAACESFLKLKSPSGEMLFLQFVSLYFSKQKEADWLSQELSQVIRRIKLANSPQTKNPICGYHDDAESQNSRDSSFSTSQLDRLSMLDSEATDPLKVSFPIEYFNSKLPADNNMIKPMNSPSTQPNLPMSAQEMSDFIREASTSEEVKGKANANFESSILAAMISLLVGLIASKNRRAQSLLSQRMGVDGFEKMATLLHQMLSFYNLVCDSPLAREKTTQLASEVLRFFTSYL